MGDHWYERAFGELYPELYAHRTTREAEAGVSLLESQTELRGRRVVDIACGTGRHLARLQEKGAIPRGIDLSDVLLRRAASHAPVIRGDMRFLPFLDGSFDGALSMFTSFGYFDSADENRGVLREIGRVVREGGWFFMDYLNRDVILRNLVEQGERRVGDRVVREERHYDPRTNRLIKEIRITGAGGKEEHRWEERLMLFSPDEIESGIEGAGFRIKARFGRYDGRGFDADSDRLILFSTRGS